MFNAKIKAVTVLCCGVAVLVVVAGGLLCLTRAVAAQRERAEAERRQAEEALLRQEVEDVRQGLGPNLEKALDALAELRAKTRERFNQERQLLMERMKKLEMEEREALAKIEAKVGELRNRRPAGQDSEKLDRILERLDRIEQRLGRLERANKK